MAKIIKLPFRSRDVAARRVNADPPSRDSDRRRLESRLLNTDEACRCLKVSRPTLLKYIAAGKIRASKIGRGWKIREADLTRFLSGE